MADAAPPPLQMPAAPNSPDFNAWTRETTIREPELPMGWPRATAPLETIGVNNEAGSKHRQGLSPINVDLIV